jgi:HEPN domain-containing protein
MAKPFELALASLIDKSDKMTKHAVDSRHPGDWYEVSEKETREMIELAKEFASILIPKINEFMNS